jgi:hypothetical protein
MNPTWDGEIGLANAACKSCGGYGRRTSGTKHSRGGICNCVLRAIFRTVFRRWQRAGCQSKPSFRAILLRCDFELAAARSLKASDLSIFKLHFVAGGDWRSCCKALHLDRGDFFHAVYRVEETTGRALLARGIFPLFTYFNWGHQPTIPCKPRVAQALERLQFARRMAPEEYGAQVWQERSDGIETSLRAAA